MKAAPADSRDGFQNASQKLLSFETSDKVSSWNHSRICNTNNSWISLLGIASRYLSQIPYICSRVNHSFITSRFSGFCTAYQRRFLHLCRILQVQTLTHQRFLIFEIKPEIFFPEISLYLHLNSHTAFLHFWHM